MSDYKVFNDNGEEKSWEELYEDNVALTKENEKLNHYKLLYQKVKERNDKAIEYIYNNSIPTSFSNPPLQLDFEGNIKDLLKILEGNNETD